MPARKITSSAKDSTANLGFEADMGPERAGAFRHVRHPDRCSGRLSTTETPDDDMRWQWSGATWTKPKVSPEGERRVPPKGNANFAWVQHFIRHLAPQGMAGFVLANGSMSSNQSGEGDRISTTYPLCA